MSATAAPRSRGRGKARHDTWRWKSTDGTRRALLSAARELFLQRGYTRVKVADVVSRAGVSTGSFYHHFGAKQDLYTELWQDHCDAQDEACEAAVAAARQGGEADPVGLWAVAARAILQDTWTRKDLARVFLAGECPPDFEATRRDRNAWLARRSGRALRLEDGDQGRLYANCLQGMIRAGAQSVVAARDAREARLVVDSTIAYCLRLMPARPVASD